MGLFDFGGGGGAAWKPWKGSTEYAKDVLGQAQDQYNYWQPTLPDFWATPDLSPAQQWSAAQTFQRASAGSPLLDRGQQTIGGIAGGNYLSNPYTSWLTGGLGPNAAQPYAYGDMMYGQNPNAAAQYLLPTARGDYLTPENNPYLQNYTDLMSRKMVENFREATSPTLDAYYNSLGPGGVGSPAYARGASSIREDLGEALGDMYTKAYLGAYGTERDRQLGAGGTLADIYNQDYRNRLAGTGQFADISELGRNAYLNAGQAAMGDYRSGIDQMYSAAAMAPDMAAADYYDLDKAWGAGQNLYDQEAARRAEAAQRHDYYYGMGPGSPYSGLNRYSGFVHPYFGGGMQQQAGGNNFWSTLGNIGSFASIFV